MIKIDGINLAFIDECQDIHGLSGCRGDLLDLLRFYEDILSFFVFVSFYDFGSLHKTGAGGTKQRLFEPRMAFVMKLVQRNSSRPRRGIQANRNGN